LFSPLSLGVGFPTEAGSGFPALSPVSKSKV
jgi:hypothetical protein